MNVNDTLERLDRTLDTVDELINELPLSNERKHQLTAMVYDLWMEVEHDMALPPTDWK